MYFLLLWKTFAHTIYILCKQLFNIKSRQNKEHNTIFSKKACCTKAQMDFIPPSLWLPNSPHLQLIMWCDGCCKTTFTRTRSRRGRAAPVRQGGMGQSWSASDQQCNQGMAQETVILHCSWWRTFRAYNVNMTALLRVLMQHACLIINWILCCVLYSVWTWY